LRGPSGPPAGAGTAPTANAVATPGARRSGGQTFGFDGSLSTDADGRIVAYAWTLGGKVVSTQPQFSRFLSKTKRSYRVTLTVTADTGLTGSTTVTVSARAKRAPVVRIVVPGTARFCYACFRLSPSARHLVSALRRYARAARTVTISSYADSTGAPGHNLALTRRRTRSVADALLGGLAPRPSRTWLHWYGSHHPVASNTTAAGRGRNRRTEIRIVR
jgi:outer membrane protein OmpA-like peptidoglycan-associated protein